MALFCIDLGSSYALVKKCMSSTTGNTAKWYLYTTLVLPTGSSPFRALYYLHVGRYTKACH